MDSPMGSPGPPGEFNANSPMVDSQAEDGDDEVSTRTGPTSHPMNIDTE